MKRWSILLSSLLLSSWLFLTACTATPPSDFEAAQNASTEKGATAVVEEAIAGSQFNAFFPAAEGDYDVVYTQEKTGFAQAKLKQSGTDLAVLSIADITSNPSAADKYANSTNEINGYPTVEQGKNGTGALVGDRFQVKVQSRSEDFSASDRQTWLAKFDLDGLAALQ
ncbi:MAG: hypothetical protein F6J87_24070 [Spirulina sp. SIO3F2]|nr:hypothetical protein [Spirulina sp. SIO3F2]